MQEAQTPPIVSLLAGGFAGGIEAAATVSDASISLLPSPLLFLFSLRVINILPCFVSVLIYKVEPAVMKSRLMITIVPVRVREDSSPTPQ